MKRIRISDFAAVESEQGRISDFRVSRRGFTLIELMVSVALAIIILTLFATIYSWSTETYSTQKGIRRNDQRSRMMVTVIKGDLNNRSFRDVVPFWPGQLTAGALSPPVGRYVEGERRGYFCISENDPDNNTDDVLFLTVEIPNDNVQRSYQGRAKVLFNPLALDPRKVAAGTMPATYDDNPTGWARYVADHPDQPEHDDGQVNSALNVAGFPVPAALNTAGRSRAAEVAYFLRNGNLYRRILLIRDPYDEGSSTDGGQPELITGAYTTALVRYDANADNANDPAENGYFWRDFAFSAYHKNSGVVLNQGPKFHSRSTSLNNYTNDNPLNSVDPDFGFPRSLGIPPLRFGYSLGRTGAAQMLPREYADPVAANQKFFGRFLTDETSHSAFLYPGAVTLGDPHTRADLSVNTARQMIDQYDVDGAGSAGTTAHRGEDILMTNVHEFDVKVWDRTLGQFVDLGHTLQTSAGVNGEFHRANNRRETAPPFSGTNPDRFVWNRYDTWHPYNTTGTDPLGEPPYRLAGATNTLGATDEPVLLAVQITIRFYDVQTKQMRQLTIQHSLKK